MGAEVESLLLPPGAAQKIVLSATLPPPLVRMAVRKRAEPRGTTPAEWRLTVLFGFVRLRPASALPFLSARPCPSAPCVCPFLAQARYLRIDAFRLEIGGQGGGAVGGRVRHLVRACPAFPLSPLLRDQSSTAHATVPSLSLRRLFCPPSLPPLAPPSAS